MTLPLRYLTGIGDLSKRSGLLPSRRWHFAVTVSLPRLLRAGIRSLSGLGRPRRPPCRNSSSTPCCISRGCSKKHFEENQLSPGSISFSLQPTSHPKVLRHFMVRTSSYLSIAFILLMDSSPGFGSSPSDKRHIEDSLSLRIRLILPYPRR